SGSALTLQTNGANNLSQGSMNLANGTNITFTNTTGGTVTASITGTLAASAIPNPAGDVTGSYTSTTVTGLHFGSTGIALSSTTPTSGQCLEYNGTNISSAACSGGSGAPGGATTQIQYNNVGAFGGTSNLTYSSATGQVTLKQLANGNQTLYGTRATDTSPSGNFIDFQNAAASTDLFKVDASGNVTATSFTSTSTGPAIITGSEGTCSGAGAGKDILCAGDSTTHTIQASLNGGAFAPIPLAPLTAPVSGDCVKWGANWTLADQGGACGSGGSSVTIQTNGTNNASQATLNLVPGSGISLTNTSGGSVTIAATGSGGGGTPVQKFDFTAQTANAGYSSLVASPALGMYRFSCYVVLTTAATTSSTLPGCYVQYQDADTSVLEYQQVTANNQTANTVGLVGNPACGQSPSTACEDFIFRAAAGVPIKYALSGYASSGTTAMQYAAHIVLEGPF
ncbi:MAG: hypothetical protein ACRD2G_12420, partial [Terriglobia bacterium]